MRYKEIFNVIFYYDIVFAYIFCGCFLFRAMMKTWRTTGSHLSVHVLLNKYPSSGKDWPSDWLKIKRIKWLVSKETLCCVGGQVRQLVDYQLEVDKGKLTAVANLKS